MARTPVVDRAPRPNERLRLTARIPLSRAPAMRHSHAIRRFGLMLTVPALTALAGQGPDLRAQGLPSLPHTIEGACQLECCRLGSWTTTFAPLAVHPAPGDRTASRDSIPARTTFTADSTVVVVRQFGIAVADEPVPQRYRDSPALAAGDTVYLVRYEGEDWFRAIVRGQTQQVHAFWVGPPGMRRPRSTRTYGHVVQELQTEWWVQVRLPDGRSGWINMTQVSSVRGPDACSQGG